MSDKFIYNVSSPSNIALLKYWGKKDKELQWPANISLSMTLNNALTKTSAYINNFEQDSVLINGTKDDSKKALNHLNWLRKSLGENRYLSIESTNSFPSSCGIASSASGMSALTIAALAAWSDSSSFKELNEKSFDIETIAQFSRMGSGSACRSLWGGIVSWDPGDTHSKQIIKQLYPADHWDLSDLIVIINTNKKRLSSSEAHQAAWTSPIFAPRIAGINFKFQQIKEAIENKNLETLGPLIEAEAIEMHAVMMTGVPPAFYWTRDTENFISWLRREREQSGLKAWFTIDAGPNVHVLCEAKDRDHVISKIKERFNNFEILVDRVGTGPTLTRSLIKDKIS